jgi:hypothetical protein
MCVMQLQGLACHVPTLPCLLMHCVVHLVSPSLHHHNTSHHPSASGEYVCSCCTCFPSHASSISKRHLVSHVPSIPAFTSCRHVSSTHHKHNTASHSSLYQSRWSRQACRCWLSYRPLAFDHSSLPCLATPCRVPAGWCVSV